MSDLIEKTTDAAIDPPKKPTAKTTATAYVVLQEDEGSWNVHSDLTATSSEAAIRDAISGDTVPVGSYVAVPARSWKPVRVTVETVSRVKLEDA